MHPTNWGYFSVAGGSLRIFLHPASSPIPPHPPPTAPVPNALGIVSLEAYCLDLNGSLKHHLWPCAKVIQEKSFQSAQFFRVLILNHFCHPPCSSHCPEPSPSSSGIPALGCFPVTWFFIDSHWRGCAAPCEDLRVPSAVSWSCRQGATFLCFTPPRHPSSYKIKAWVLLFFLLASRRNFVI